jgi:hypothetical protein
MKHFKNYYYVSATLLLIYKIIRLTIIDQNETNLTLN